MKKGFATQIMLFAFSVLALAACGKSGGDSPAPPVATVPPNYQIVGQQCMNTVNNTAVAYNLCQQNGVGGYSWNGSQCLQTNTGTVVDPSLCNNQYGNQYGNGYQVGQGAGGPYVWNPYPNGHYPIGYFPTGYPSFPGYGGGSGGYQSQTCNGIYLWTSGGSSRWVTCSGWNCRGYFVYTQTTYRPILCL